MKPYPIFLVQLADRHTVVIGGSHEAEGKVEGLLNCDATITVISPTLTPTLHGQAQEGAFTWLQRPYQTGDLAGAFLVISERFDPETNARIWDEGERVGALVNVMDDIPRCNFVAGSVVRQGPLTISISTSGAAPALAVRLRQKMEAELGSEYATFLEWMQELRTPMAENYPTFQERKRRWYELIDSEVLDLIRAGQTEQARRRIKEIVELDLPA